MNKITITSASKIYQDKRELLFREEVVMPNGHPNYFLMSYFKPFVVIIPVLPDGSILMLKQYRHGVKKEVLSFPGGFIEPGETPKKAAIRELNEETGYSAQEVIELGRSCENAAKSRNPFYIYTIQVGKRTKIINPDLTESKIKTKIVKDLGSVLAQTKSAVTQAAIAFYLNYVH